MVHRIIPRAIIAPVLQINDDVPGQIRVDPNMAIRLQAALKRQRCQARIGSIGFRRDPALLEERSQLLREPILLGRHRSSLRVFRASRSSLRSSREHTLARGTSGIRGQHGYAPDDPPVTGLDRGSVSQVTVIVGRAARRAVGHQGEAGDVADSDPTQAFVEPGGVAVGDGVEDQKRLAARAGGLLGGAHQGLADAPAAGSAGHQHLRQVGAVRLVFGEVDDQLHGAAESLRILGRQDDPAARGRFTRHATPERLGPFPRQREHEADRGPALDAIDQQVGEPPDRCAVDGIEPPHGPVRGAHPDDLVADQRRCPVGGPPIQN
ncbi:hypothetical protein HK102_010348, partial [Quaeritorhiza haematococci]